MARPVSCTVGPGPWKGLSLTNICRDSASLCKSALISQCELLGGNRTKEPMSSEGQVQHNDALSYLFLLTAPQSRVTKLLPLNHVRLTTRLFCLLVTVSHYVAQACLKLMIFLSLPPKCWESQACSTIPGLTSACFIIKCY